MHYAFSVSFRVLLYGSTRSVRRPLKHWIYCSWALVIQPAQLSPRSCSPLELLVPAGNAYGLLPRDYFIPRQAPCQLDMPYNTPFRPSLSSAWH
jgi:hypothetical protein